MMSLFSSAIRRMTLLAGGLFFQTMPSRTCGRMTRNRPMRSARILPIGMISPWCRAACARFRGGMALRGLAARRCFCCCKNARESWALTYALRALSDLSRTIRTTTTLWWLATGSIRLCARLGLSISSLMWMCASASLSGLARTRNLTMRSPSFLRRPRLAGSGYMLTSSMRTPRL